MGWRLLMCGLSEITMMVRVKSNEEDFSHFKSSSFILGNFSATMKLLIRVNYNCGIFSHLCKMPNANLLASCCPVNNNKWKGYMVIIKFRDLEKPNKRIDLLPTWTVYVAWAVFLKLFWFYTMYVWQESAQVEAI